jgi:hypothetical protein
MPNDSLCAEIWCIRPSTTFMSGSEVIQNGIPPAATTRDHHRVTLREVSRERGIPARVG